MPKEQAKFKHALVQGLADLIVGGDLFGGEGKVDLMTKVMLSSLAPILPSMLSSLDDNPEAVGMIREKLREILAKDAEQFPPESKPEVAKVEDSVNG